MKKTYTISEAKNRLPAIIHRVEIGATAQLTRHGKPVAVLVSINEYNKTKKQGSSFWQALCAFRETVKRRNFSTDEFPDNLRDKAAGRRVVFK
ncbi:MAG: type II toxin-antitoxin system prevent-host-death family antitoxin [Thermodesulfobacteriota bacterium]